MTFLSSMSVEEMGPSLTVEGATTVAVFEAYVKQVLAPSLRPEQAVVMENLCCNTLGLVFVSANRVEAIK